MVNLFFYCKSEETKSQIKAHFLYLANSYFCNYKPSPRIFHACLRHTKTIKFAGDTVLYFSHRDFHLTENSLNDDTEHVFEFLTENELILNAKKGKTELRLFGTTKRLSKLTVNLNICYGGETLNQTNRYKYLGTLLILPIKRHLHVCVCWKY